ncbi:Glycerophosphoryl diester phosphodiesterase [Clostridiaceae bacterium JG1575]|nr:Glycerophosphoryl diester phosphodiesterase [Clostridiaceae bacterium JG1575]
MKIFAHRGYSMKYPENTEISFLKAIEAHCDGLECDVQLTKDDIPVILHDETIDRTSSGSGRVCDYTYAELLAFDFAHAMPGAYGPQRLLTLPELLLLVRKAPQNLTLNIELKNSVLPYEGLEEIVLKELRPFRDLDILISSFNHRSIQKMKQLAPHIPCAPLLDRKQKKVLEVIESLGVKGVHPSILLLDEELIRHLKQDEYFINVYTVNDPGVARLLDQEGVDGIFTDCCLEMKEALTNGTKSDFD